MIQRYNDTKLDEKKIMNVARVHACIVNGVFGKIVTIAVRV